jgi:hypothetical protein
LIDADALSIQVMDASYWDNQDEDVIWNLVQDAPTVDAVEVVHGRWIKTNKYDEDSSVQCSKCLMEFDYIDGVCYLVIGSELPNYCPNCGAYMRGDEDD